ncbi:hypothetical protein BS47DRAFT_1371540 [Hydnum rufescens UP504]|uniref:Metallo-dependent hydrolase n=1 Tax=Hydnum rufescens UP504 TaxID=1448309 RepID=A0A9P6B3A7_9AGAM|nr:hypothetical protein BS47DRAFT_1371540 [Hydnum rufescens UP504]
MSILNVDGQSGRALASLSSSQISFLQSLPKAELHAHLNGCIPLSCLQDLARELDGSEDTLDTIKKGLAVLQAGVNIDAIGDFFPLFPAIYHITSTPDAISVATSAVLDSFLASREGAAALIVSIDRRMHPKIAEECVELALLLRSEGKPVVGVDLCGDPHKGDMGAFRSIMQRAKQAALGITVHIAETPENTAEDTATILDWQPSRLGHATFLDKHSRKHYHPLNSWLKTENPVVICTDDTLPFRTTLLAEYALLLAAPPLGFGFSEDQISAIAARGLQCRF